MPEALIAVLAGLLIGSFLNVCIYRMPRDLSVVSPRSFCPNCETPISWYDNVPLLSYVLLRGSCRKCGARIAWRYPVVEAATGASFGLIVALHGPGTASAKMCLLAALLIGLTFSDFEELILPDEFTLGGMAMGFVLSFWAPPPPGVVAVLGEGVVPARAIPVVEAGFAAAFAGCSLWLVGKLYEIVRKREGLGLGDVKMIAMVAAYLGLPGALATLIAGSLAGSLIGGAYILLTRKDPGSHYLPFGSFLGVAGLLVVLFAGAIFSLYPDAGRW